MDFDEIFFWGKGGSSAPHRLDKLWYTVSKSSAALKDFTNVKKKRRYISMP